MFWFGVSMLNLVGMEYNQSGSCYRFVAVRKKSPIIANLCVVLDSNCAPTVAVNLFAAQ
jgi:hypothetical protein